LEIKAAQREVRLAYVNGGVGVLVSALVWIVAGLVTQIVSLNAGMAALFFGGMAIHPVSLLLVRQVFKKPAIEKPNPLEALALQSTPMIFVGLFVAFAVSDTYRDWFFAIALLAIGARYLIFQTIYGLWHYAVLGIVLMAIGFVSMLFFSLAPQWVALIGGGAEIVFAIIILQLGDRPVD
jgi:hypothetical protein